MGQMRSQGLYDPVNEHDACGVGMVAHIKGEKSHGIIEQALEILEKLDHRGRINGEIVMVLNRQRDTQRLNSFTHLLKDWD